MNTYIVLLRGINVTGKNILPMKELTAMLEELGCKDVLTYIQSGNVVLKSKDAADKLSKKISKMILGKKGFEPKIIILEEEELKEVVRKCPFKADEGKTLHFFFMETMADKPNIEKLESLKTGTEKFKLSGKIFYLYAPDGIGNSKLAAVVEKCLGVSATARNWNTVEKLLTMIG